MELTRCKEKRRDHQGDRDREGEGGNRCVCVCKDRLNIKYILIHFLIEFLKKKQNKTDQQKKYAKAHQTFAPRGPTT